MQVAKRRDYAVYGLMVCIILCAFALRMHKLSSEASFSSDEMIIIHRSMYSVPEIWELTNHTPLQALWLHFWAVDIGLGYAEFPVYFTSVVVGMLAIAVAYRLGRLLFDRRVGLLCAFMLAFSAYHIFWSRSVRYYGWTIVLSGLSFLCLYRALVTNRLRAWGGYALFRTLSLYNHLSVLPVWAGESVFALGILTASFLGDLRTLKPLKGDLLAKVRQRRRAGRQGGYARRSLVTTRLFRFIVMTAIIVLLFAPRAYFIVRNAYMGTSGLRISGSSSEEMAQTDPSAPNLLHVSWQSPITVLRLFDSWVSPLHTMMMIGLVGGFFFCALRRQWTQALLVFVAIVTPFVLFASFDYKKPINSRYLISLLPLYYLMASRGISGLVHRITLIPRLSSLCRSAVLWGALATFTFAYVGLNAPRIALTRWNVLQNWRGVGQFLAKVAQPGQLIVVNDKSQYPIVMQYYLPGFNVVQRDHQVPLQTLYRNVDGFWLVSIAKETYDTYQKEAYDLNPNYVEFVFSGVWHPDMDQTTDFRAAYSWDLNVAYISRSITSPEEALALYTAWIPKAETQHLRDHLTWARAYQRLGRLLSAVPEYTMALNDGYVNDQLASHILDARGTCWWKLGQAERAIADWQQAVARADSMWEPHQNLAGAYLRLGWTDAAYAVYQAAIAANPRRAWPHMLLGNTYRLNGSDEQAISELAKAIEVEPSNPGAYRLLAQMYRTTEETRVIPLYQEAMQSNPLAAWPHLQLGEHYQGMGKMAEAVFEYQRAVELEPEYEPQVSGLLRSSRWDLGAVLSSVKAYSDQGPLVWWPDRTWVKPYPSEGTVMVGRSTLAVEGQVQPGQLLIHPFGDEEKTHVQFQMPHNPFAFLHVGYGLADRAAGLSNGVEYLIEIRKQGDTAYEPLFKQPVTQNVWRDQVIPLAYYWGDDLDFRLTVDARGEYAYDWLQTTIELLPPPHVVWDLSANLDGARFLPDTLPLVWRGSDLCAVDGSHVVARSEMPVGGQSAPGQVHFHPFSSDIDSTIVFTLPHHVYHSLKTSYALADEAISYSNGVDYAVNISTDGGESFTELVRTTVTTNNWRSFVVDLPPSQDLVLQLSSSARQDATFDWLQVTLALLPFNGDPGMAQSMIEPKSAPSSRRVLSQEVSRNGHLSQVQVRIR